MLFVYPYKKTPLHVACEPLGYGNASRGLVSFCMALKMTNTGYNDCQLLKYGTDSFVWLPYCCYQ